ncbi:TetR/AcrR family transcriptional regulator [Weeksella virosa]|uniref:TetR/AcrR family transcriptional regulator n=1 Tax=Weeksella virosa TaxID=1014 RepID=UPI00255214D6|nr:TetR/AcrR family transcriptional regulator [Weeksella virosa]MDK7375450.1 TetR/AcrR family transcriptional regulator [Weeksella virosa]
MKDQTEEIIKNTAKRMFFGEGKFHATTQEIADEAGVNRTLINYYFRSRDNLFEIIFNEARITNINKTNVIADNTLDFREMVAEYIDDSLSIALQFPYLDIYIVTQMNNKICYSQPDHVEEMITMFLQRVEEEMEKGTIAKMEPIQFLLNMISLINFPSSIRPLLQHSLHITDEEFERILSERKEIILQTLFQS